MAEFILKDKVKKIGISDEFYITSRATSFEEVGNPIYYAAKKVLEKNNIFYTEHIATKLRKEDYNHYDYFICMDDSNVNNSLKIFGSDLDNKIIKLLEKDIEDPWYTENFDNVYKEISKGLDELLIKIKDGKSMKN